MVWQCDRGWFGNMTMQYCTVPFITSLLMPMGEDKHGQCIGSIHGQDSDSRTRKASSPILKRHFVKYRQRKQGQLTNIRKASQAEKTPRKTRNKKEESRVPAHSTCIAMCVPTQNARLGYHFQPPSRTKTIEKIIAVMAAAHHALASAAADRASHWAAMPNHQPSCFALSKLPCVAQAYYSVSNQL